MSLIYDVLYAAVVGDGKTVYVYDVDRVAGTPIASIQLQVRVNDLSFIEDEVGDKVLWRFM